MLHDCLHDCLKACSNHVVSILRFLLSTEHFFIWGQKSDVCMSKAVLSFDLVSVKMLTSFYRRSIVSSSARRTCCCSCCLLESCNAQTKNQTLQMQLNPCAFNAIDTKLEAYKSSSAIRTVSSFCNCSS